MYIQIQGLQVRECRKTRVRSARKLFGQTKRPCCASIERKLLQMAKVYMDEADFDDSDTWFHDGQDDEPKEQEVKLEVSVTIRLCKK